ncbi:DNA invertase Pin-like site-specific DNA recombinase [Humibacillus xanthopallidus]|uniref:DNA invertase Pin-like site-specific DNA recombinase n=1 Tax=Humibacillus xanthopallidus TaxID=412689 RepID=A0A543PV25_9MICO|nr:recombinase family protein [Humibacillus xanthopallidus]TQN47925.1 DNA invertase Pin-like site-specific DNA recombinase [Humibacillus xanthopallidus]
MNAASTAKPLRAVIYVRLSSYKGETDSTTSPQRQREACEAYCLAKGWEVVEVVEDLNVSGSDKGLRLDRPGLRRVRELLPAVDVVIFSKLDRLARNVVDFDIFAKIAAKHDVALVSVAESLDLTTPGGRFVAQILAAFGEMEAATIAQRTAEGIAGAVKLGRWRGGATPYGYRTVTHSSGSGRGLEIEPEEAAHVRAAAEVVLSGGSLYRALQVIRERGSVPRRAEAWSISSLRVVLLGPSLLGHMTRKGEVIRGDDGRPVVFWPPILTEEEASRLRAALARKPAGERRRRASRLLSGLLTCASCHGRLRVGSSGSGGTGTGSVIRYVCRGEVDGRKCDSPTSIDARLVEEYVAESFLEDLGDHPVVMRVESSGDLLELADVEAEIRDLGRAITEPGADVGALASRLTLLQERRAALSEAETTVSTIATGETLSEAWAAAEGDVDARRALLAANLAVAVVHKGRRGVKGLDKRRVPLVWQPLALPEAPREGAVLVGATEATA